MSDKDVNIKLKLQGSEEAKQQFAAVGDSAKQSGENIKQGQEHSTDATEKANQSFSKQSGILGDLKSQVVSWVSGFVGLAAVSKMVDDLTSKLVRASELLKRMHETNLTLQESGQRLELQTGTVGKQDFWAKQVSTLQKQGGLASPGLAQQIFTSIDIAHGLDQGQNNKNMQLAYQLAPMFGASGMNESEISSFVKFASTAGVKGDAESYKEFYAKVRAGFTSAKSDNFGQYVSGLQQGTTTQLKVGGSVDESIAMYNAALSVSANEALAATLTEQAGRLSGGGYAKPRQALERFAGTRWETLSADERMQTLLRYSESIPEAKRTAELTKQGFPAELAGGLVKLASPEGFAAMDTARKVISGASADDTDQFIQAYTKSALAKSRANIGLKNIQSVGLGSKYGNWQDVLEKKTIEFEGLAAEGKDRLGISDSVEPYLMILEQMQDDLSGLDLSKMSKEQRKKIERFGIGLSLKLQGYDLLSGRTETQRALTEIETRKTFQEFQGLPLDNTEIPQNIENQTFNTAPRSLAGSYSSSSPAINHIHYHNDIINDVGKSDYKAERFTQD